MGNSGCCPASNPCDHTVDETQGLLNSPDSKVSARPLTTDGISHTVEVEDSKKEEGSIIEQDAILAQPTAAPEGPVQSSYGSVIQMLHTDVSLAAQTSPSASPVSKVSDEPVDSTATETEHQSETTKEIKTSVTEVSDVSPDKAPAEIATANVKVETEAEISDLLEKEHTECEPQLMVQEAAEGNPADDVTQENMQEEVAEEDTEKKQLEADKNEDSVEEGARKEEEEINTPIEVFPAMEPPQPIEPVLNSATAEELEIKGLVTQMETATENNVDSTLPESPNEETPVSLSEPSCEEKVESAVEKPVAEEVVQNHEDHDVCVVSEMKEEGLPPKTQETLAQESSPAMNIIEESTVNYVENGQVDNLTDVDSKDVNAAEVIVNEPQVVKLSMENQEIVSEPSADCKSVSIAENLEKPESDTAEIQTTIPESEKKAGAFENGVHTSAPVEKPESTEKPDEQVDENEPESKATAPSEAIDHDLLPQPSGNDERTAGDEKEDAERNQPQKGEIVFSSGRDMKVALIPVCDIDTIAEKEPEHEDIEDLYRADNEIEQEQAKEKKLMPLLEFTIPGVEEKCSLAAPVDILAYSEREWKGNTAKSNLIRKGYSEISCSFSGLRRVRGDNYCSLRATLYQVLATTTQTPAWLLEDDFTSLPEKIEVQENLVGMWVFPPQCVKTGEEDAVEKLKHYLELLQKRWKAAAESESPEDKQIVCDEVFQGGEEEYALLEVLKFLMLVKAIEFHNKMQEEQDVPVFCWLLFARDTSENPKMFFSNHLSQVGFSGGLEQVEMFLLGYALQHTIQAFRLYKTDTEEFVTHYPDDHKQDWPCVCVITEDDRHYNVPVRKPTQYRV